MRIESVVVAVGAADNAVVAEMLLAEMLVGPSRWEEDKSAVEKT